VITGLVRYFTVQAALTKGNFPVAKITMAFITTALGALVMFGVLMGVRRYH
jgi:hypothetical protein